MNQKPSPKKAPKRKPKRRRFALNKKAFDAVMQGYRDAAFTGVGVMGIGDGSKSAPNVAKPSLTDFRCDVDKVINKMLNPAKIVWFKAAYVIFDSPDAIEKELHAQRMMGEGRHELEQNLGEAFIKLRLYPLGGNKGYFHTVRRWRNK